MTAQQIPKKTVIYGTLGPACRDSEILEQMFREGMDGIRLNLSHTGLDAAAELIEAYHRAAQTCGLQPELLIDLQGPELRIGRLSVPLNLESGSWISTSRIPFPKEVLEVLGTQEPGQELLLDDGKLLLCTTDRDQLRVVRGGILESRKSVALPGQKINTPALTDFDLEQLRKAKAYGVTGVMQPFVRSREDLLAVRTALHEAGCDEIKLFAKIENLAGLEKINELIPESDQIVIARGDLGNAMELWELPVCQKRISELCRAAGRDYMVVTQMLDSMTHRPVPTRAEVSDIFNAVLDGAASVMVTGETAAGEYPVLVIRYLVKTVREAERYLSERSCP